MTWRTTLLGLVSAALLCSPRTAPAWAQSPPAPLVSDAFQDEVAVPYVLVPLVARDRKGIVTDLERKDVRLYIDGRRTELDTFDRDPLGPARILFIVDLSGSMGGSRFETTRSLIRCFLERRRPGDQFALATFSRARIQVEVEATSDVEVIETAMRSWEPYGETALHDAVFWAPELTPPATSTRQAVVLITDGTDNASQITSKAARERVQQAELPVYAVGLDTGPAPTNKAKPGGTLLYAEILALLAEHTGGQYHPLRGPEDGRPACDAILTDLRQQYILGFPTIGEGPIAGRRIRIQVRDRKKVRIAYRRTYRGTAPK